MPYPEIDVPRLVQLLQHPNGPCDVVIDTDTANEIDDQFAIVHAILSEVLNVEAIYAAPFHTEWTQTSGPDEGMELSYQEILRVLDKMPTAFSGPVLRGSAEYMSAPDRPVSSAAAGDVAARAMADRDGPLYVLALGALTNIASAILVEPAIVSRMVVLPLGGSPYETGSFADLNFTEDVHAVRVLFDSGVPVVHVVGYVVSEMMRTTEPEMSRYLKGRGALGDYLYELYRDFVSDFPGRSKPIWDMAVGAWLMNPDWTSSHLTPSPIFNEGLRYSFDPTRHPVRVLTRVNRDAVFNDLFEKLETLNR